VDTFVSEKVLCVSVRVKVTNFRKYHYDKILFKQVVGVMNVSKRKVNKWANYCINYGYNKEELGCS